MSNVELLCPLCSNEYVSHCSRYFARPKDPSSGQYVEINGELTSWGVIGIIYATVDMPHHSEPASKWTARGLQAVLFVPEFAKHEELHGSATAEHLVNYNSLW